MLCACIDIGSNTTRVLVAQAREGRLVEVLQQREFTRIGARLRADGHVDAGKVEEVARIAAAQRAAAAAAGAERIRVVATAAIRAAGNRDVLCARVREVVGIEVEVLDGEEEARLAFLGATRTLADTPQGPIGVVDVGGGSTELAVGTVEDGVGWSCSLPVGSGAVADAFLHADPPRADELASARGHVERALAAVDAPPADRVVAVGGSATSLRRLAGGVLDEGAVQRALAALLARPAAEVARRHDLHRERVRLLPAGLVVLDAVSRHLGRPLEIGRGGLREGVCLALADRAGS